MAAAMNGTPLVIYAAAALLIAACNHPGRGDHSGSSAPEPPDIASVPADLVVPAVTPGEPAAGMRVRQQLRGWEQTDVYHMLYLPRDWTPEKRFPVIVEFPGNGPYRNRYGDTCSGRVDDAVLGYGLSGGEGFIWLVLPPISEDHSRNHLYWWGDLEATVEYCIAAVRSVCAEFGGDPGRVVLTGFSRGAIACNYVGLHNQEIAGLWCAFMPNSHYDGVREWSYPGSTRRDALQRLRRLDGRPTLVVQERSVEAIRSYIEGSGVDAPFTFTTTGFRNHTDAWTLRDVPARRLARAWLADVLASPSDR